MTILILSSSLSMYTTLCVPSFSRLISLRYSSSVFKKKYSRLIAPVLKRPFNAPLDWEKAWRLRSTSQREGKVKSFSFAAPGDWPSRSNRSSSPTPSYSLSRFFFGERYIYIHKKQAFTRRCWRWMKDVKEKKEVVSDVPLCLSFWSVWLIPVK